MTRFRPRLKHLPPGIIATVFLIAANGCGNDGSVAGSVAAGTEAARATYAEHEHHVPKHKPESFPDAVESLQRRTTELEDLLSTQQSKQIAQRSAELQDIVGWLPVLGADSDLREADWEPIHRAAIDLERLYSQAIATTGPSRAELFSVIDQKIDALAEIAAAHRTAFEVVPHPDHDHHHHDHHHDHE